MKILSLKLQNFMSHQTTELNFGDGVFGIVGLNGSGKSTIIESILYAIYGYSRTNGSETDLIRFGEDKMSVTLEMLISSQNIKIERGKTLKGYTLKLFINGADNSSDLKQETQRNILKVIGIHPDAFESTIAILQNESDTLLKSTSSEVSKSISKVFGYGLMDLLIEDVRKKKLEATGQADSVRTLIQDLEKSFSVNIVEIQQFNELTKTEIEGKKVEQEQAQVRRSELAVLYKSKTENKKRNETIRTEIDTIVKRQIELNVSLKRDEDGLLDKKEKILALDDSLSKNLNNSISIKNLEEDLLLLTKTKDGQIQIINTLEKEIVALRHNDPIISPEQISPSHYEKKRQELDKLDQEISDKKILEENIQTAELEIKEILTKQGQLKEKLAVLANSYASLSDLHGVCDKCGQPVSNEYKNSKIEETIILVDKTKAENDAYIRLFEKLRESVVYQSQILDQQRKLTAYIDRLDNLVKKSEVVAAKNLEIDQTVTQIKKTQETIDRQKETEKNIAILRSKKESLQEMITQTEKSIVQSQKMIDDASLQIENKKTEIVPILDNDLAEAESILEEGKALKSKLEEIELFLSYSNQKINQNEVLILQQQDRDKRLVELNQSLTSLAEFESNFKNLESIYLAARSNLVKTTIEKISSLANIILSKISHFGYQISVRLNQTGKKETLDIAIGDGENNSKYRSFSGGERAPINIAIHLAMSQMLSGINGVRPSFIFLDEVFAAVDETGKEGIIGLFSFLRGYYDQIFVITHQEGINDLFGQRIVVKKSIPGRYGITKAYIE